MSSIFDSCVDMCVFSRGRQGNLPSDRADAQRGHARSCWGRNTALIDCLTSSAPLTLSSASFCSWIKVKSSLRSLCNVLCNIWQPLALGPWFRKGKTPKKKHRWSCRLQLLQPMTAAAEVIEYFCNESQYWRKMCVSWSTNKNGIYKCVWWFSD